MDQSENKKTIFAYGSNMNSDQIKKRCPSFTFICPVYLLHWELVFNKYSFSRNCGAANIRPKIDHITWGIIFHASGQDTTRLDDFERGYTRSLIEVQNESHLIIKCETYMAPADAKIHLPSQEYLNNIIKGAQEFNLPDWYLNSLENHATSSLAE